MSIPYNLTILRNTIKTEKFIIWQINTFTVAYHQIAILYKEITPPALQVKLIDLQFGHRLLVD